MKGDLQGRIWQRRTHQRSMSSLVKRRKGIVVIIADDGMKSEGLSYRPNALRHEVVGSSLGIDWKYLLLYEIN